ncbi:MAG: hypothetical protein P8Y53_04160 [Pseudolabrys sp.]
MLKKLMIGAALGAMVATPAFAQAYDPNVGSGNIVSPNGGHVYADTPAAYAHVAPGGGYYAPGNAYAYAPGGAYAYGPPRSGRYYGPRWYRTPGWWPFY